MKCFRKRTVLSEAVTVLFFPLSNAAGVKANTPRLRVSLGAFAKLRKSTISFAMSVFLSVRPSAWTNFAPTERILMEFDI